MPGTSPRSAFRCSAWCSASPPPPPGAGEAGAGIFAAGQQAALGKLLAFTRVQEATADATGAKFLREAGISGKGMLQFFKKLANEEYSYGLANIDPYAQTHPLSNERVAGADRRPQGVARLEQPARPGAGGTLQAREGQAGGLCRSPMRARSTTIPKSDNSIYAHYARAYAWHKAGYPDKADAETLALIAARPHDPYFLEIRGQILLEAGEPVDAIAPLKEASELTRYDPLIVTTYGHALIATEDKANYAEAERVLRIAVNKDDDNPFAWYQLGTVYELKGDTARAMLATAERASMTGDMRTAVYSARGAMAGAAAEHARLDPRAGHRADRRRTSSTIKKRKKK